MTKDNFSKPTTNIYLPSKLIRNRGYCVILTPPKNRNLPKVLPQYEKPSSSVDEARITRIEKQFKDSNISVYRHVCPLIAKLESVMRKRGNYRMDEIDVTVETDTKKISEELEPLNGKLILPGPINGVDSVSFDLKNRFILYGKHRGSILKENINTQETEEGFKQTRKHGTLTTSKLTIHNFDILQTDTLTDRHLSFLNNNYPKPLAILMSDSCSISALHFLYLIWLHYETTIIFKSSNVSFSKENYIFLAFNPILNDKIIKELPSKDMGAPRVLSSLIDFGDTISNFRSEEEKRFLSFVREVREFTIINLTWVAFTLKNILNLKITDSTSMRKEREESLNFLKMVKKDNEKDINKTGGNSGQTKNKRVKNPLNEMLKIKRKEKKKNKNIEE